MDGVSDSRPSVLTVFVVVAGALAIVLGLAGVTFGGLQLVAAIIAATASDSPAGLLRASAILALGAVVTGLGTTVLLGAPRWISSRRR